MNILHKYKIKKIILEDKKVLNNTERNIINVSMHIEGNRTAEHIRVRKKIINDQKIHEIEKDKSIYGWEILYPGEILLTIDDGYEKGVTESYCEYFSTNKVPVTFFMIGETVSNKILNELRNNYGEYCSFYLHGYTHRKYTKLKNEELKNEIEQIKMLEKSPNETRLIIRLPYGDGHDSQQVLRELGEDIYNLHWNINPEDYLYGDEEIKKYGIEQIVEYIYLSLIYSHGLDKGGIVLMHQESNYNRTKFEITTGYIKKFIDFLNDNEFRIVDIREKKFKRKSD